MTETKRKLIGYEHITADEIDFTRQILLASKAFKKSPRMSRLLFFLVDKAILESARDTSEYAIGIEVFDRDPMRYSPGEDPAVRVQVGRLRTKLKSYYASSECNVAVEIEVPLGCYMPIFRRKNLTEKCSKKANMFSICQFKCVSQQGGWEFFTQGLHEELTHHLYKKLGRKIIIESPAAIYKNQNSSQSLYEYSDDIIGHRLEGSVHVDSERIRASVRLIDVTTGCVAWSEQFNRVACIAIAHQQELASSICHELQSFLSMDSRTIQEHIAVDMDRN